jgi:DNA-binding SARP family transcriptional activator/DNA-binding beta-propeller fold protein YncE
MEFRILGPLEACDSSGAEIRLPTGRERALLAALLLRRGEVVSTDSLVDALWGKRPPSTAAKAVQGYVSHLRRALGDGVLITQSPGYVLRVDVGSIDAERFEQLAAEGRRALEDADPGGALASLDAALALWRGPALSDFTFNDFAQSEIQRLTERRLETQEDRIDALLELGRDGGLVAELDALVAARPGRERLRAQLMLALYRSGRQADALDVFRDGRRRAAELGLDPGPDLVRLEKAILNHDPSLEPPVVAGVERPSVAHRRRASPHAQEPVPPDSVAVIDPQRSRVVGHVLVGRRPVALAIGHGSIWVANADDGTVSRIDPDRREVMRTIGIGAPAIDLAVAADAVWVANGSDGTVSRIDPGTDAVVETIDVRGSSELVWNPAYAVDADDDSVWIAAGRRHVLRIDPTTNEPSATIDVGHVPVGLALALRIELQTNTATAEVPIGDPVALTVGEQAVWASDVRGQIWRINPDTATVSQTTPVGKGLVAVCTAHGMLFAANNADGTVVQIDAHDGRVVGIVPVGHAPTDVAAVDGKAVWVSVQGESAM